MTETTESSHTILTKYFVKKTEEYEKKNKELGPTMDPLVSPLVMAHGATVLVAETCVYTITPIIEKNQYVKSALGMCLDVYMRFWIMIVFVYSFANNCLSPTKKDFLKSHFDTNMSKVNTIGIYLSDVLYESKKEEIDEYLKQQEQPRRQISDQPIEQHGEHEYKKEEDEELNRNYG